MAQIKHIAIRATDPEKTVAFYKEVFGLKQVGLGRNDPTIGVFARSFGVLAGMVFFGLLWSPWQALGQLGARSFLLLAFAGFLASFVGQLAFYQALKIGQLSSVTPLAGTYPLVAALLGWWLLREPMTAARLGGVLCVVVGVWLLSR